MGRYIVFSIALLFSLLILFSAVTYASYSYSFNIVASSSIIDPEVKREVLNEGRAEAVIIARDMDSLDTLIRDLGQKVIRQYTFAPYALVDVSINDLAWLALDLRISSIAPNFRLQIQPLQLYPVSFEAMQQEELSVPSLVSWALFRMGVTPTWKEFRVTGKDIIIATLDTGVNIDHPLIRDKIFTVDPDDPKYPGGWIEFDGKGNPVCSEPRDTQGHGTWVTSIAVGGDTESILVGVAPNAKFIHALVLPGGFGTFAQVLAGIEWAADPYICDTRQKVSEVLGEPFKPHVVSMSFGALGNYSNYLLPAIKALLERNIIPVAAIGNGGPYSSSNPGNIWGVFAAGALNRDDTVAFFSSGEVVEWPEPPSEWPFNNTYPKTYTKPDFTLPGVLVIGGHIRSEFLAIGSGTSASAPLLAGTIALIIEALGFQYTVEEIYGILYRTVQFRPTNDLDKIRFGNGVVNTFKAVALAKGYELREFNLSVDKDKFLVGDRGTVTVEGYNGRFSLLFDDQVFIGRNGEGTFEVPPSDYGPHYIHAYSLSNGVYGYTRVSVDASIEVSIDNAVSGDQVLVTLNGFPMATLAMVRYSDPAQAIIFGRALAGQLIDLVIIGLRGFGFTFVFAPFVQKSRSIYVEASDLSGLVRTSTLVTISPPTIPVGGEIAQVRTFGDFQIIVAGPSTVNIGDQAKISIYTFAQFDQDTSERMLIVNIYRVANGDVELVNVVNTSDLNVTITLESDERARYVLWIRADIGSRSSFMVHTVEFVESLENRVLGIVSPIIQPLSSEIESIRSDIDQFRSNLQDFGDEISRINELNSELQDRIENLAEELRGAFERINNADARLNKLSSQQETLATQITDLRSTLRELEADVSDARDTLDTLLQDISSLKESQTMINNVMIVAMVNLIIALAALVMAARSIVRR